MSELQSLSSLMLELGFESALASQGSIKLVISCWQSFLWPLHPLMSGSQPPLVVM